jgi:hypothetical protein
MVYAENWRNEVPIRWQARLPLAVYRVGLIGLAVLFRKVRVNAVIACNENENKRVFLKIARVSA